MRTWWSLVVQCYGYMHLSWKRNLGWEGRGQAFGSETSTYRQKTEKIKSSATKRTKRNILSRDTVPPKENSRPAEGDRFPVFSWALKRKQIMSPMKISNHLSQQGWAWNHATYVAPKTAGYNLNLKLLELIVFPSS